MKTLRIGYIPLVDAAVPIAAAEFGFAEEEGLNLELVREVSWANIRDKLILDMFDAAHMLAPLAIATSLGIGHVKVPLAVPFVLNFNGNCITLAAPIFEKVCTAIGRIPADARESALGLARVIGEERGRRDQPLQFGVVFPYSTHSFLIRHWLRLGGVDVDRDVQLIVVPPSYMAASLSSGLIQGCCVGNPWNSLAVDAGVGAIAALGAEIASRGPDKVLALPQRALEKDAETTFRLVRALRRAALWCEVPSNRRDLALCLARPNLLNVGVGLIEETLSGGIRVTGDTFRNCGDFLLLGRESTNRPDPRHARWIFAELAHAGHVALSPGGAANAGAVYRHDVYDAATREPVAPMSGDAVGLSFGPSFDGDDLPAYLDALDR
ncbi:MAG: ABC transporter substrate-binding protein [Proteobacteria bacterium]|nr:ABC transporter substrate-binding protein [Pseudomonadota bacterium]